MIVILTLAGVGLVLWAAMLGWLVWFVIFCADYTIVVRTAGK